MFLGFWALVIWPIADPITHIGCVVLDVVEGVDEVGSELQPESLADREVLVQAEVNVAVMRRTQI